MLLQLNSCFEAALPLAARTKIFFLILINLFRPQGPADYYFALPVITDTFLEYSPTFRSESHPRLSTLCNLNVIFGMFLR